MSREVDELDLSVRQVHEKNLNCYFQRVVSFLDEITDYHNPLSVNLIRLSRKSLSFNIKCADGVCLINQWRICIHSSLVI